MKLYRRPWLWTSLASAALAALFVFILTMKHRADAAPPLYGTLADFQLVDQTGKPFGAADLRGKAWVANFIFTRCPTVCPVFTAKMAEVQKKTSGVHLVSFSVDPGYDKPPVLAAYAAKHGADPARWTFLTGDIASIKRTVVDGLKIMVQENPDAEDPGEAVLHGSHFVLLDGQMRVRGYYDSADAEATARMLRDIRAVK